MNVGLTQGVEVRIIGLEGRRRMTIGVKVKPKKREEFLQVMSSLNGDGESLFIALDRTRHGL